MPRGKEKHYEAIVEEFTKTFHRTTLNLEHRNLLTSILVEDLLLDIKNQTEENTVGWLCQLLAIIQVANQFFEEFKTTVLGYKSSLYKTSSVALETIESLPIGFTNPKTSSVHLRRLPDIIKDSD